MGPPGGEFRDSYEQRNNLKKVILGGFSRDDEQVEDGLKGLNWLSPDANQEAVELFVRFCHYLLEPLRPQQDLPENLLSASGKYCWQQSELIQRVGTRGAKNVGNAHFEMPAKDEWKLLRDAHNFPYYFNPLLIEISWNPPLEQEMCCGIVPHYWWREYPVRTGQCPNFSCLLNEDDGNLIAWFGKVRQSAQPIVNKLLDRRLASGEQPFLGFFVWGAAAGPRWFRY